jgi:UDP-glucose 4-epimerase
MVVPRFVSQALAGQPLTVYGDGKQTRCFLHVADAVDALLALAESPQAEGEVFNVGSAEEVSILELARRILELVDSYRARVGQAGHESENGQEKRITLVPYEQAYEAGFEDMQRRVPDTSKILRCVGWKPRRSLNETLEDVIQNLAATA